MDNETTPETLVARSQAGDTQAFAALVALYETRLQALARSLIRAPLREALTPEEVVQETLTRAVTAIGRFKWKGEGSFVRWLGGIVRFVISEAARKQKVTPQVGLEREVVDAGGTPSRGARREERFDRLQKALSRLTAVQRQVIRLSRIEGLKAHEIAARTGRTPEAVRQILVRGLRSLRENFGETRSFSLPDRRFEFGDAASPGRDTESSSGRQP